MGKKLTGINPKIIQWARERARYFLESVAVKFKKDVSVIEKWVSGEDFPTYSQLEKLAEIYTAFPVHKRYILNPEKLNQQRLNRASQMREPL